MMKLKDWEELPKQMRTDAVRPYYDTIRTHAVGLAAKRLFDLIASLVLLAVLLPVFALLAIAIKLDSPGPVIFKQTRVGQNGRHFKIYKFRLKILITIYNNKNS